MSRLSVRSPDNWRSYDFWNLIIAVILAIFVLLFWFNNKGLSRPGGCCGTTAAASAAPAAATIAGAATWGADGKLTLTGAVKDEATKKKIFDDAVAKYGAGNVIDQMTISKDGISKVVLTGEVASEAEKKARGDWAAALYGAGVMIDNQLTIKAKAEAVPAKPPVEKIYFNTGNTEMDQKGRDSVARVIAYLKATPTAKAVISGFHDPRGSKAQNELLAKDRGKAVRDELRGAGIEEARIEMRKPQETTGTGDLAEARRVELSVE